MTFEIPDELLDAFAKRVVERVAETMPQLGNEAQGHPENWRLLNIGESTERLGRSERWISITTLERAKKQLGAQSVKLDFNRGAWELPESELPDEGAAAA